VCINLVKDYIGSLTGDIKFATAYIIFQEVIT